MKMAEELWREVELAFSRAGIESCAVTASQVVPL